MSALSSAAGPLASPSDDDIVSHGDASHRRPSGSLLPQRHDSTTTRTDGHTAADAQDAAASIAGNGRAFVKNQQHTTDYVSTFPGLHSPIAYRRPHNLPPVATGLPYLHTSMDRQATDGAARATETPTISCASPPESSADDATQQHLATSPISFPALGNALRSAISTSSLASSTSLGLNSAMPSPYLASMTDLTPLPSPVMSSEVPIWRRIKPGTPTRSRTGSLNGSANAAAAAAPTSQPTSPTSPSRKKKTYSSLMQEASIANATSVAGAQEHATDAPHTRNRSISEFVPEQLQNVRQRNVTIGSSDVPGLEASTEYHMHREANLAAQRGLSAPPPDSSQQIPTPPPSNASVAESDDADDEAPHLEDGSVSEYLEIHCGIHNKRRKFRQLRQLGEGTFSKVMLATRERIPSHPTPETESALNPHQLVAVKVVMHGPAGGADEERIETSLRREVEMLQSISHPSLIHLKACEWQPTRTLLVLTYCPGGDMFEFASQRRELLSAPLVQRMFAELVSAVTYLHGQWIVHRDIKLENVLVNLSPDALRALDDPAAHPTPILTLTDLGLSRRIPSPPESPLLTTRCGSEDYAAPEILLGQPYDGRLTDAWALGVLLYALLEGRLPFDAPPGRPDRSRNTHRIARADWIWCRFGDADGDWDAALGHDFAGAQPCVEGLLKKVRMGRKPLPEIAELPWVKDGIRAPGGLRVREEDESDELL